jgi:hypothetical protein
MKPFHEKLEKERKPEPKPEEGKELTDEQRRNIIENRKAEQVKIFRELDRLM